jgi:predicted nuclease of predicted toxin-antitoxin system
MSDKMIRQYAIDHNYIITTKDADFYEMNLVYGQPPKIIRLKQVIKLKRPLSTY